MIEAEMLTAAVNEDSVRRFSFKTGFREVPLNGVYLMFESGEQTGGLSRIVRVGTHITQDRLPERLRQHFTFEQKNRSILRKNVGRALLKRDGIDYLDGWNARRIVNRELNKQVEEQVSAYMRGNFTLCVVECSDYARRVRLEAAILATILPNQANAASVGWLGRICPDEKIAQTGLWQVAGSLKDPLTDEEMSYLTTHLIRGK